MTSAQAFPTGIKPSSRSYSPGTYPSTDFESLDGTKTHLRFGNKRVNATLQLGFSNISDQEAALILANYENVNSDWDYVTFNSSNGTVGIGNYTLANYVQENTSGLKWRYAGPPTVTSVFKGRSNVSCSFVACLDAP
tara:strand:+ start:823 stop:1233 length:411 start_codon:yes stop_codon:yes gene_type:complete